MANPAKRVRNRAIYEMVRQGASYSEVGREFRLSKGRIAQIFWEERRRIGSGELSTEREP